MSAIRSLINVAAILTIPIWGGVVGLLFMMTDMVKDSDARKHFGDMVAGKKWLFQ